MGSLGKVLSVTSFLSPGVKVCVSVVSVVSFFVSLRMEPVWMTTG
jgi:hypothetical protein